MSVIAEWKTPCQKRLQLWASVQIPIQIVVLLIKIAILKITSKSVDDMTQRERKTLAVIHYFNRLVNFLWMAWFIVGAMLRFGKSDCSAKLLLTYVIINSFFRSFIKILINNIEQHLFNLLYNGVYLVFYY